MACLGVHFAITDRQRDHLVALETDDERRRYVQETIEPDLMSIRRTDQEPEAAVPEPDGAMFVETGKAWDPIHRTLAEWYPSYNGGALHKQGFPPLNLCILGGRKIMRRERNYIIRLIDPVQIAELSDALQPLTRDWMRERYFKHCRRAWPEIDERDFDIVWGYFEILRTFFAKVRSTGRSVIFTVDQ